MTIHETAIIADGASIDATAKIGPYCTIGANVNIGANVELKSHVNIDGKTTIGEGTRVFPFASLGTEPQDLKFSGEVSELIIGKNNTIREHATMNPGTAGGGLITRVGDNGLFMMGTHVAHDCQVGNNVIMANNATLAGHVIVGDGAIIGGLAAVHQFVRIGRCAMIGGMAGVANDIIPYGSVSGERAGLSGLNLVGLKRQNIERDAIHELRNAYKDLFEGSEGTLQERADELSDKYSAAEVQEILDFLSEDSSRSFCVPKFAGAA